MREITIVDMTLRECEHRHGSKLSFREKLEIAKQLEKLRLDVIETGYVSDAPADAVAVRTLADTLKNAVLCCPVGLLQSDIDRTWQELRSAHHPRLNLVVPASVVQMEYTYHLKQPQMLVRVAEQIAYCVTLTENVEFTAEDATRSEPEFLIQLIKTALKAGATTITLADSAGQLLPQEVSRFVTNLRERIPELDKASLSLHLKDDLNLACANALMAIVSGVDQFKVTFNGLGEPHGNLSLEQFAHALYIRRDALQARSHINITELQRTCKQISQLFELRRDGHSAFGHVVGPTAVVGNEQNSLSANADLLTVRRKILELGYELPENDIAAVYDEFKRISEKKQNVYDRDMEALIADIARQVAPTYKLINYVINSGNAITTTAFVNVNKNGSSEQSVSLGDGPIDAAFLALEQVIGHHFELEDFQIQAVTEGREAMGDALVKLRYNGKLYSGRGLSTDIIGASILAYINAVNKIVYEERS